MHSAIICVPSGRRRCLNLLLHSLEQSAGIERIDLWLNTNNVEDIEWIHDASSHFTAHPIRVVSLPNGVIPNGVETLSYFYSCYDEHSICIKMDDDLIYVAPDCIPKLIEARLAYKDAYLVYGNVINHNVCSILHIRNGVLPNGELAQEFESKSLDHLINGLNLSMISDGRLANALHESFVADIESPDRWKFDNFKMRSNVYGCINCVAYNGALLAEASQHWIQSDEMEIHEHVKRVGGHSIIVGDALSAHLSYSPQISTMDLHAALAAYEGKIRT